MIWIIPRQHFLTGCQVSFPQGRQMQGLLWRQTGYCEDVGVTAKIVVTVKIRGFFFLFFFFFFSSSPDVGVILKVRALSWRCRICVKTVLLWRSVGYRKDGKGIHGLLWKYTDELKKIEGHCQDTGITIETSGLLWTLQGWVTVIIIGASYCGH